MVDGRPGRMAAVLDGDGLKYSELAGAAPEY
jgi:hypothetical protein